MQKSLKIASVLGVSFMLSTTALAWFHGGTVHDVHNEIKQAVEKAKLGEIEGKIGKIKENMKTMNKPLENLAALRDDIQNSIGALNAFKKKTTGILNDEKNSLKELYTIKLADEATLTNLEKESKRLDALQEKEILQTIDTANDTSEAAVAVQNEVKKVRQEYSEGLISEQQKNVLLKGLAARMANVNAMNEAQSAANTMAADAREASERQMTAVIGKQYEFGIEGNQNKATSEQVAESRIKLP